VHKSNYPKPVTIRCAAYVLRDFAAVFVSRRHLVSAILHWSRTLKYFHEPYVLSAHITSLNAALVWLSARLYPFRTYVV